nr:two-component system sensor kinase [Kibdelosporangium sp. MJ126-NF4]CTQ92362.1 two-component system sensor kinase [Kibdelosporangium sp. MJ126-NF4]
MTAAAVVASKFGLAAWASVIVLLAAYFAGVSARRWTVVVSVLAAIAGFAVAATIVVGDWWSGPGPIIPAALLTGAAVGDAVRTARELAAVRVASAKVIDELSSLLGEPRDPGLDLDSLLDDRVEVTLIGEQRPLPAPVDVTVYRIVQESLANARKYGTGWVQLTIEYKPDELVIEVRNERASPSGRRAGHGLIGLRERVALVDGQLSAGPEGRDFVIRAVLWPTGRERSVH